MDQFFAQLVDALVAHPTAAILALVLIAFGWFVRYSLRRDEKHAAEMKAAFDAHLQTAMQVAPLASKLVTCVEVLERLSNKVTGGA